MVFMSMKFRANQTFAKKVFLYFLSICIFSCQFSHIKRYDHIKEQRNQIPIADKVRLYDGKDNLYPTRFPNLFLVDDTSKYRIEVFSTETRKSEFILLNNLWLGFSFLTITALPFFGSFPNPDYGNFEYTINTYSNEKKISSYKANISHNALMHFPFMIHTFGDQTELDKVFFNAYDDIKKEMDKNGESLFTKKESETYFKTPDPLEDAPAEIIVDDIPFLKIPRGKFWMGCSPNDKECAEDEFPRHRVAITKTFYMSRTEIKQNDWIKKMGENPSFYNKERIGISANLAPVESVSWYDIQKFIKSIKFRNTEIFQSKKWKIRLPTEAEWEYAARAGVDSRHYMEDIVGESGCSPTGGKNLYLEYIRPRDRSGVEQHIGFLSRNAFGLYGMLDSVYEWTKDSYNDKIYSSRKGISENPFFSKADEKKKVVRGFACTSTNMLRRVSGRAGFDASSLAAAIGFRLVITQE